MPHQFVVVPLLLDVPVEAEGVQEGELWAGAPPVSLLGIRPSPVPHADFQK